MDIDVPQPAPTKDISTPYFWSTKKEDEQPKFGTQYTPTNPSKLLDPGTLTSREVFCDAPTTEKLVVQVRATEEANNRHIHWNHWTNEYQITFGIPFEIMVQKADPARSDLNVVPDPGYSFHHLVCPRYVTVPYESCRKAYVQHEDI